MISLIIGILSINCAGTGSAPHPEAKQTPPFQAPQIPPAPDNVQNYFLENGLEVFTVYNSASPMVCLNMTVKVGSSVEEYPTSGMSHMLEHLLFNGTESRTQDELYDETDFYGAYSNAFTRQYFTDFILLLPKEYLTEGMDIQSDMLFHSLLPADKLEKERGIVIEEIRKDRDRESNRVQDVFNRMNYGTSGTGLPVIGTISTIKHMSREDILEFYHHYYVPNNMVLTVIGNFDPSTLKTGLESWYGDEVAGSLNSDGDAVLNMVSSRHIFHGENGVDQAVMDVSKIYGQLRYYPVRTESGSEFARNFNTTSAINDLVQQMITAWMQDDLSEKLPKYQLSVSESTDLMSKGIINVDFMADAGTDISGVIADINRAIVAFSTELPEKMAGERVNAWLKNKRVEESAYRDQPHYYGMMKAYELATSGGQGLILASRTLSQMTGDMMSNAATGLHWTLIKVNIVQPADISESSDNSSGEVTFKKSILPSGAILITSSGGGSEMMGIHILVKNRSHLEADLSGGAEVLHAMLDSGTDTYTKEELSTNLNAMGAITKFIDMGFIPYDDYYNSPEYGYIRLECLDTDAEDAIRLLAHMMTATTITDEKVALALEDANNRLMMQKGTARETARTEFNKLFLGENHPSVGRVSGSVESLARLNTETLEDLRGRYFSPENYIITISSRRSHQFYQDIFNSIWTTQGMPAEKFTYPVSTEIPVPEKIIDMGKEQAQILIGTKFDIPKDDISKLSLVSSILSDRMAFDLRETRGLAYSLGISMGNEGDTGWLTGYIGTGTENIETAVEGMKSYFYANALDGLTAEEILKTINAGKGAYLRRNLTRIGQAFYMGYYEYFLQDYSRAGRRYDDLEGVTPSDLEKIAGKYLTGSDTGLTLIVK